MSSRSLQGVTSVFKVCMHTGLTLLSLLSSDHHFWCMAAEELLRCAVFDHRYSVAIMMDTEGSEIHTQELEQPVKADVRLSKLWLYPCTLPLQASWHTRERNSCLSCHKPHGWNRKAYQISRLCTDARNLMNRRFGCRKAQKSCSLSVPVRLLKPSRNQASWPLE